MNGDIIIRTATGDDLTVLYQFEQGVIAAERPYDTTLKDNPIRYYDLQEMIHATNIELVVAEINGAVIASGYARLEKAQPYLKHSISAYLGFMYVIPEHRGKGINRQIIASLQKWAHAQNIHELRLEVYYGNEPAIKAYEKIGFSRYMITMRFNAQDDK